MQSTNISHVRLRNLEANDLPRMFEFNLDPEANQLAMTIPRTSEAFHAVWDRVVAEQNGLAKAITVDDVFVGYMSCFKMDGRDAIGYWIDRQFWGKGIASKALELFLEAVPIRPLHATVATSNPRSLRVLLKCGFVIQDYQTFPATDRYLSCEEAVLFLK